VRIGLGPGLSAVRWWPGRSCEFVLLHGGGQNSHTWDLVLTGLGAPALAIDLPGHGQTPASAAPEGLGRTFNGLADALEQWVAAEGLNGVDMVGSSMGAQLVLEMSRRGRAGAVVALDPPGFWQAWERNFARISLKVSGILLRAMHTFNPAMLPLLASNPVSRTMLLIQLLARPWTVSPDLLTTELIGIATQDTFQALTDDLTLGPAQTGPAALSSGRVTLGWGRRDRLCFPWQADRAAAAFPGARMRWFDASHFPAWEQPNATVDVILAAIHGGPDGNH